MKLKRGQKMRSELAKPAVAGAEVVEVDVASLVYLRSLRCHFLEAVTTDPLENGRSDLVIGDGQDDARHLGEDSNRFRRGLAV